ncbi:hypothetical protein [Actinomadura madurae]|uniref:hypothetical protein n=1 Tax=Actinomadura madurae TaxID=1993 RepID=UPI0020D2039E|nr:hypothetical protein [Actinomadura madurae]MCP9947234.1 hypothetical protein [Actinomadura madurae]MCP9963998.1 hypothetical protein [Actinomadura madurae]MCP9976473.1 hypothetical protein [Actinomadura madurae]MCQ0012033.1 hypothetical protein [Actinomadura madurae]MCQ0012665.1 hypothetical protein [Actinomadura madurae]
MKVWIATSGSYSDYRIEAVFAREEDARAFELGEDFEEYEVHDGPLEVRDWWTLRWFPQGQAGADPYETSDRRAFDGHPNYARHEWLKDSRHVPHLIVQGWDLERVRKVFSEQRAQWLARKDMGIEP